MKEYFADLISGLILALVFIPCLLVAVCICCLEGMKKNIAKI